MVACLNDLPGETGEVDTDRVSHTIERRRRDHRGRTWRAWTTDTRSLTCANPYARKYDAAEESRIAGRLGFSRAYVVREVLAGW
jgi:hypothetical protein